MEYKSRLILDIEDEMRNYNAYIDSKIEDIEDIELIDNEQKIIKLKNKKIEIPFFLSVIVQFLEKKENLKITKEYLKGFDKDCVSIEIIDREPYQNNQFKILIKFFLDNSLDELVKVYSMELFEKDEMIGYCDCKPEDKDYDLRYKCCGHGCDWSLPCLRMSLTTDFSDFEYEGDMHDIWEISDKYYNVDEKTKQINGIQNEIEFINEYLEKLNKNKQDLLEKLLELEQ